MCHIKTGCIHQSVAMDQTKGVKRAPVARQIPLWTQLSGNKLSLMFPRQSVSRRHVFHQERNELQINLIYGGEDRKREVKLEKESI